jgi:hypothetical protein
VASTVLAGSLEAPGAGLLVEGAGWLALVIGLAVVLALSLSSALGSRSIAIGVVLGLELAVMPALLQIRALGSLRELLPVVATDSLAPSALFDGEVAVPTSVSVAVLVVAAWTLVPLAAGAWRTCKRDA